MKYAFWAMGLAAVLGTSAQAEQLDAASLRSVSNVSEFPDTARIRYAASWSQLTSEQREIIDIVAADIWETERDNGGMQFMQLSTERKNTLRAEAMERLGMEAPRVAGVEV